MDFTYEYIYVSLVIYIYMYIFYCIVLTAHWLTLHSMQLRKRQVALGVFGVLLHEEHRTEPDAEAESVGYRNTGNRRFGRLCRKHKTYCQKGIGDIGEWRFDFRLRILLEISAVFLIGDLLCIFLFFVSFLGFSAVLTTVLYPYFSLCAGQSWIPIIRKK